MLIVLPLFAKQGGNPHQGEGAQAGPEGGVAVVAGLRGDVQERHFLVQDLLLIALLGALGQGDFLIKEVEVLQGNGLLGDGLLRSGRVRGFSGSGVLPGSSGSSGVRVLVITKLLPVPVMATR